MYQSAAPGLSYAAANGRKLVTVTDDVLGIKREIQERWPGFINVYFEEEDEVWVLTQIEKSGTESLLFTCEALDRRVIERLQRADNAAAGANTNIYDELEKENQRVEQERERNLIDKTHEMGERLIHAFKKDGIADHPDIYGVSNRKIRQQARGRGVRNK